MPNVCGRINQSTQLGAWRRIRYPILGQRGIPPHVTSSDVRQEGDRAYHIEAFYRWRLNDNISMNPGLWVILNPWQPEEARQTRLVFIGRNLKSAAIESQLLTK